MQAYDASPTKTGCDHMRKSKMAASKNRTRTRQPEMEAACEGKLVVATARQELDVGAAEKSDECGVEALREVVC
jgi:hypothetical protein